MYKREETMSLTFLKHDSVPFNAIQKTTTVVICG
jgi:hypothetical protein